jgi:membrane-bound lytic murein transglycosylase D
LLFAACAHLPSPGDAPERRVAASTLADRSAAEEAQPSGIGTGISSKPQLPDASAEARRGAGSVDLLERLRSGFALPRVEHGSVRREIEWYLRHTSYLDRTFRRGARYLHHIVERLEARNMPRELALVPVVESAFDPFADSPCSASGLWQFIPSTGRRYGLAQDWWYDGRRDVLAATRAALDHLQALHEEFAGDWLLALAAYNGGAANVKRAVERSQREGQPADFFHLDLLPETRAYVPKLLALSRLVAEPEAFGVALPAIPDAPYFARVEIDAQIDLDLVADLAEIPREELRALNPAFKRFATSPSGPHQLLVPVPARERFERVLASLPPEQRLRLAHHRVRRGDTLEAIARRHGTSVAALRAVNRVRGSLIHPGQDLLVPLPKRTAASGERRRAV